MELTHSSLIHRFKSMDPIAEALGVDPKNSPEVRRATFLAEQDYALLADLVRLRREQGISQESLAKEMGVSQATVSAFEKMDNDPKLSTIRRYAHAVGALVHHQVERDEGQLHIPHEAWTEQRLAVTAMHSRANTTSAPYFAVAGLSQMSNFKPAEYEEPRRTDFARAA